MKKGLYLLISIVLFLLTVSFLPQNYVVESNIYRDGDIPTDKDVINTGGSIKITIDLLDSKVNESIEISTPREYTDKEIKSIANVYSFGENDKYDLSYEKQKDSLIIKSTGPQKSLEEYLQSSGSRLGSCFDKVSYDYDKESKKITIATTQKFYCMTIDYKIYDSIDFSIKTYNKVYDNNADEVKGNIYTWHINADNKNNKKIFFVVGNNTYVWYYYLRFLFYGLGIVAAILFVLYLVVSIFKHFSDKANKM